MYLARSNSLPNFSIISLCTMQLCEYVFPIGFPRTQNGIFGGFEGEEVKIMCSNPDRHYPAWIRVCWCIACQNRFNSLSSTSAEKFCVHTNKEENWVVTLATWGKVTPGGIFTKCGMWADMVDVITYALFGDCRLRCVGVVRGDILPSPIDLRYRLYNTGHTQTHCDHGRPARCITPFWQPAYRLHLYSHYILFMANKLCCCCCSLCQM